VDKALKGTREKEKMLETFRMRIFIKKRKQSGIKKASVF